MANFSIEALEERIKALEDLKEIQESNDNSLNQVSNKIIFQKEKSSNYIFFYF